MPDSRYRWYILALSALTFTLVMGMPTMALPVLFPEIGADLGLNLVQIGTIWGFTSLAGIFMMLMGGALGDRVGAKRVLVVACILIGVLGALRGLATSYVTLAAATLIFGLVPSVLPTNVHKTCAIWFAGPRLGLANGVVSTGMALGFMLGSLLSASVLSPWLGGWRHVLYFFGAIAIAFGLVWATTRPAPETARKTAPAAPVAIHKGLAYVAHIGTIWLLALGMFGIGGCIQGALGYLPTYLRDMGWSGPAADSALATFHAMSMLFTIPIAVLSGRMASRRRMLVITGVMIASGIGLLAVATGPAVWLAVILAGIVRDGFMATLMTTIVEVPGVGVRWAGTATGLIMATSMLASVIAPPVGNSLAALGPSVPFLFWSALGFLGVAALSWRRQARPVAALS
jgi:MFS family permease